MLGDADLTAPSPDDGASAAPAPLAIVDRLLRSDDLPPGADQFLTPLRDALGDGGQPADLLVQAVAAMAWGLRSYASAAAEASQLREALTSRSAIDQAKGILMAQHGVAPDAAFQMLVRLSNDTNVRLVDVARAMVYQVQNPSQTTSLDPAQGPAQGPVRDPGLANGAPPAAE